MKRSTVFLTDDLERQLQELAGRTKRPQAQIVREALAQYLVAQERPWPRSVASGLNSESSVTSENVKEWVQEQWRREQSHEKEEDQPSPTC